MQDQGSSNESSFAGSKSPVPLYHRLYVILRDQITSGVYSPGELLPPEIELSRAYGVSRVTTKRALDELSLEGLVERSRGRGTTVLDNQLEVIGGTPLSAGIDTLLSNLETISLETYVEVLDFDYVRPPAQIADTLNMARDVKLQKASRLRFHKGKPLALSTSYIIPEIAKNITREQFQNKSLINLITETGNPITTVNQSISATLADNRIANLLKIPSGSALIRIRRTFFVGAGKPVDHVEILYPAERFEYKMTLKN